MGLGTFVLLSTMSVTLTSYRPIPSQTDSTPNFTSIGHSVHEYGAAVSQDLLATKQACYGDVLEIPGYGYKIINDTMNPRLKKSVDMLVFSYADEKKVGKRLNVAVKVYKSPKRACSRQEAMNETSN